MIINPFDGGVVSNDIILPGDPTTSLSATTKSYVDTTKQAKDATLTSLSALGTAADKIAYTTAVDTWAETPLTSAARSVLDDATVSDIVNTIGGAPSTGSGGLVRATSPSLVTPSIGAATGTSLTVTGTVSAASMNVSGLTASYVVATDASKNLTSIQYTTAATSNTLAQRDSNAGVGARRFYAALQTLTDAATIAVDMSYANFSLTLGGNRTLGAPTNLTAGQSGVITVKQDATGSRTLAYAWPYVFPGGAPPTLSTAKFATDQLNYFVSSYSTGTCTMTIATPCVVTKTAHGFVSGMRVQFTTTGTLPTGLSLSTTYWVFVLDVNTFQLSTSFANLQLGTYVATSGTQSGTHTVTHSSITVTLNAAINA